MISGFNDKFQNTETVLTKSVIWTELL